MNGNGVKRGCSGVQGGAQHPSVSPSRPVSSGNLGSTVKPENGSLLAAGIDKARRENPKPNFFGLIKREVSPMGHLSGGERISGTGDVRAVSHSQESGPNRQNMRISIKKQDLMLNVTNSTGQRMSAQKPATPMMHSQNSTTATPNPNTCAVNATESVLGNTVVGEKEGTAGAGTNK